MRLLYHNAEYEGNGAILTVLALSLLTSCIGIPASNALASMQRPRAIVVVGSIGAAFTVILITCLTVRWGLVGAAFGFLAGNLVGTSGRWAALLLVLRRHSQENSGAADSSTINWDPNVPSVIRVVQQLTQSSKESGWELTKLGEASEAFVYTVQEHHHQPIWHGYRTLVVKLYKPGSKQNAQIVAAQYNALSRLHMAMHDRTVHGWAISVPKPLYLCNSPLALVMTQAPGQPLTLCPETGDGTKTDVLDSAARAIVAAMESYWSLGQLHGDLGFDNILCDVRARALSFVDPDATRSCSVLQTSDPRNARIRDIGIFLTDIGLSGDRNARDRKRTLFEGILRAFVETTPAVEDQARLLHEIRACARAHLQVQTPWWSLRRWWWLLLRRIVSHQIDTMLIQTGAELRNSLSLALQSAHCLSSPPNAAFEASSGVPAKIQRPHPCFIAARDDAMLDELRP
jgi:Polysaccharide biosynthesis C-terminal domain